MHCYIHIPFCDSACRYCAFYAEPYTVEAARGYLAAVAREMDMRGPAGAAATVYVGGGSPSVLGTAELEVLGALVQQYARPGRRTEWTVECNPASLTPAKLKTLHNLGVTRVSLGVQSLQDPVLRAAGRRHSAARAARAVAEARAAGFMNVGIDLIAGLPGDTRTSWRDTLRGAVEFDAEHVSVYMLSLEPGTAWAGMTRRGQVGTLSPDEQLQRMQTAEQVLASAGYARYEISNFARPGYRCRHNVACWEGADYRGFGPAACSREGRERRANAAVLEGYVANLEAGRLPPAEVETLDAASDRRERQVLALRLADGLALSATDAWEPARSALASQGLLRLDGGRCRLTARGRDVADAVMAALW